MHGSSREAGLHQRVGSIAALPHAPSLGVSSSQLRGAVGNILRSAAFTSGAGTCAKRKPVNEFRVPCEVARSAASCAAPRSGRAPAPAHALPVLRA